VFAVVLILSLFTGCAAKSIMDGTTTPSPSAISVLTSAPSASASSSQNAASYSYTIQTTVNESYPFSQDCTITFEFSRPVFEGASSLVAVANQAFDKAEADYKARMQSLIPGNDDFGSDGPRNQDWNFTELSQCTYETNGVVSFTLDMDWWMGGVHNSDRTGFTFDINRGERLAVGDFLTGTDSEIQMALVNAFNTWYMTLGTGEPPSSVEEENIVSQSDSDADFYLSDDGVHILYGTYVIPATQDGLDFLAIGIPGAASDNAVTFVTK